MYIDLNIRSNVLPEIKHVCESPAALRVSKDISVDVTVGGCLSIYMLLISPLPVVFRGSRMMDVFLCNSLFSAR